MIETQAQADERLQRNRAPVLRYQGHEPKFVVRPCRNHGLRFVCMGVIALLPLLCGCFIFLGALAGQQVDSPVLLFGSPVVGSALLLGYVCIVTGSLSPFAAGSIWLASVAFNAGLAVFHVTHQNWFLAAWPCVAVLLSVWGLVLEISPRHEKAQGVPGL